MITEKYVRIGERGQVVIPKEIRDFLNLGQNRTIKVTGIGNEIVMRPLRMEKEPEDAALEILTKERFTKKAWGEIQKDREGR